MNYQTIIGLEVHAQLLAESKMFCGCSSDYASTSPNSHVCPVCMGMPGVLPVINRKAVEYTIMTALALNCPVAEYTKFDRKNYPYPDLVKGYQISQYDAPIGGKGWLNVEADGQVRKIGITRVHLEEDTAKLVHRSAIDGDYSLVDINRSGTPLMEIVGEPDLRSPEEARQYLIKLRSIVQYLGVSTGNMEEGSFRCDANISLLPEGASEFTPKVEVKNMNSFKAVFLAMEYEARRQRKAMAEGEPLVQETRGWLDDKGITVSQRTKEHAHDYRYFPEPDLPPLVVSREWVDEIKARLPELPEARRDRFVAEYGLPEKTADLLTAAKAMADYFEAGVKAGEGIAAKEVGNWLLGDVSGIMNSENVDIETFAGKVSPANLAALLALEEKKAINMPTAKTVLAEMYATGRDAASIIQEKGLSQISDSGQLEESIRDVIDSNVQPVADYRAGKEQAFKFLVGQVMRATKGRGNPQIVNETLKRMLGEG